MGDNGRRSGRFLVVAGAGVLAVLLVVAGVAAWRWMGFGAAPGPSAPGPTAGLGPPAAQVMWRTDTGPAVNEPPVVTPERVYVGGTDGTIRAVRRGDGSPVWDRPVGAGLHLATRIVDGALFATTADGQLVAVDATTGDVRWRRGTGSRFDARPFPSGDRVFAAGRDAVLYAYDTRGHRRWRVWADEPIRTPPRLAGDLVLVAADDGVLYGVTLGGGVRWRARVGEPADGPYLAGDAACVPLADGAVRCVRLRDGTLLARITLAGAALTGVAGSDGVVYAAATSGAVGAWDVRTGAARWRHDPARPATGSGRLVMRDGELDVAYPGGDVAGLDPATGAPRWQQRLDESFSAAPRGDQAAAFVVGEGGVLFALRPPGAGTPTSAPVTSSAPPVSPPRSPDPVSPSVDKPSQGRVDGE